MRLRTAISALVLVVVASLAVLAAYWLSLRGIPGPANLESVRESVTPRLRRELAAQGLSLGSPVFIRIFKESRELEVWVAQASQFALFKTYPICAWSGELGPKLKEGDGQAPEGFYAIERSQLNPKSSYHLSFNIGFPNGYDRQHGRTGSHLMVHGRCVSIGCYAMTDAGIEEIYLLTEAAIIGGRTPVPVHIFPFRMTAANVERHKGSRWAAFWRELQPVHDHFEARRTVPRIAVTAGKYALAHEP